ncbi:MAG TPA: MBL fold metallo-hydrolase, partial [Chitinophagaceae bacterium]|nr:MBL fold metallo-hydrolase [Chitinophagaceae bacterium]
MLTVTTYTFNPVEENTYVLYNEQKECCIIDPGCYFQQERDELKTGLEKHGLVPVLLLNTHCHLDHVFGNQFVHKQWQLNLHLHEKEKAVLDFAPQSASMWGLSFDNYEGPLVYLKEGEIIRIGEDILEILFTPGHSPGSISFYHQAGGFVIGGDVLFNGSIGRTDLPGGDYATLVNSIQTRFFTLPDETRV